MCRSTFCAKRQPPAARDHFSHYIPLPPPSTSSPRSHPHPHHLPTSFSLPATSTTYCTRTTPAATYNNTHSTVNNIKNNINTKITSNTYYNINTNMSIYDDSGLTLDTDAASPLHHQPGISPGGAGAEDGPANGGLGSLADELAGAFSDDYSDDDGGDDDDDDDGQDEDEDAYGGHGYDHDHRESHHHADGDEDGGPYDGELIRENGAGASGSPPSPPPSPPPTRQSGGGTASPSKRPVPVRRPPTAGGSDYDYDASDASDGDDDAADTVGSDGISAGLEEKLEAIERLAMRQKMQLKAEDGGDGSSSSDGGGGVIPRLMDGLQNLLPQSQLETASTRLTAAHLALSANMVHQTRTLHYLGFAINWMGLGPPPLETAELLRGLGELIPRPSLEPLAELAALHGLTLELAGQLSVLSDSLHMARQSSIAAGRRLRVAKEACSEWRSEVEMVERAHRWIEDGDWDARCQRRDAAVVCRDVTSGFEAFCRVYEEKLLLLLQAGGARGLLFRGCHRRCSARWR